MGSPEDFLYDDTVMELMQKSKLRDRVLAIVFDEVHTAVSWYVHIKKK